MTDKNLFLAKYGSAKHLDAALKDTHWAVRVTAAKNPNYRKYYS